jgi:hypothetical protein
VIKWLTKANDEGVSHCTCTGALAALPAQADCPWCGCGWMIACAACERAYTFARVVEIDGTYEALARQDIHRFSGTEPADAEVKAVANWLRETFADKAVGDVVVHLDGEYLRADQPVDFTGLYAHHRHDVPPQIAALRGGLPVSEDLISSDWWRERERPDRQ